jgi:dTDP-4-amino-4,6-dideoxygalactose transaminase
MGLPPHGVVAVPDYAMIACPRAVMMAGLTPLFIDVDDRLLLDAELVQQSLHRVNVVMPVHTYGRLCQGMGEWNGGVRVIEDAAECHMPGCGILDVKCWSFYKNKIIAGEEGGAVAFADPREAALARQLRNLGFTDSHDFIHTPRGHNYRLANCLALRIIESLEKYSDNVQHRRKKEGIFDQFCPEKWKMPRRDAPWVYDMRIPGLTWEQLDAIVHRLNEMGIPARHGFKSCSVHQPEFDTCHRVNGGRSKPDEVPHTYAKSAVAAQETLYVPLSVDKASLMPFGLIEEIVTARA